MADEEDQTEENEAAEGEESEEEEGKKGGKKKLLILILVPLLLIGGGGGGAYYMGYLDSLLGIKSECPEPELDENGEPIPHLDEEGEPIECDHGEEGDDHSKDDEAKKDEKKDKKKDNKKGDKDKKGKGADGEGGLFLAVTPMVVNLSTEDGTPRLLRLKIQLELVDSSDYEDVKAVMPRIEDQFQRYLRGLRVRDLKGSAGIYRLQIELLSRVNKAVAPIEIKDILFQEILIQ